MIFPALIILLDWFTIIIFYSDMILFTGYSNEHDNSNIIFINTDYWSCIHISDYYTIGNHGLLTIKISNFLFILY